MNLTKHLVNGVELTVPASMLVASRDEIKAACNGCGTGGWLALFVPDTIWGLRISPVCDIHDWMYKHGDPHITCKELADRTFRDNLIRYVDAKTRWRILKRLRIHRVKVYYHAVKNFGGPAYWANKTPRRGLHAV